MIDLRAKHVRGFVLSISVGITAQLLLQGESKVLQGSPSFSAAQLLLPQTLGNLTCNELKHSIAQNGLIYTALRARVSGHMIGQLAADNTDDIKHTILTLAHVSMLAKTRPLFDGLYHGSVWYAHGVRGVPWEELCVQTSQEWFLVCLHGLGHSGWIKVLMPWYDSCGKLDGAPWSTDAISTKNILRAFEPCRKIPAWAIENCASGFWHGLFEWMDHRKLRVHWMYPCNSTSIPRAEQCFWMLFTTIAQATSPTQTPVMLPRRDAFEKEGNLTVCFTVHPGLWPNCVYALSANLLANPFSHYFERVVSAVWRLNSTIGPAPWQFSDVCSHLALTSHDIWLACVVGAASGWLAEAMQARLISLETRLSPCAQLLHSAPSGLRSKSNELCIAASTCNTFTCFTPDAASTPDQFGIYAPSKTDRYYEKAHAFNAFRGKPFGFDLLQARNLVPRLSL